MRTMLAALALCLPALAMAKDADPKRTGVDTRAWLELQRSGNASLGAPRPMPGEVADKVYERYLNSFGHPIPQSFQADRSASGGGSSR